MHQPNRRANRSGFARIAHVGMSLACLLSVDFLCSEQALGLGAVGSLTAYERGTAESRICNPAPEATLEDMRLAVAVLQDTTKMANWRNIAWYLGELGFPECFEPLRAFVWNTHAHSDSMLFMFDALRSAQTTIGHVAASCPQALHYLIQSADPAFWKSLPWREPRMTSREFWLAMSEASIRALGLSGASEAGQMLARLRQWPYRDAQRVAIEEALRTYRRASLVRRSFPEDHRWMPLFHLQEMMPPTTDNLPLVGAWRWMRSAEGAGAYHTPPACGWSRTLFFEQDSTYSFWERDSVGEYRMCSGRYVLHTSVRQPKGSWVELRGWSWEGPGTFWLRIMGPDLIRLLPGDAGGAWHHYGVSHTFVREGVGIAQPDMIDAMEWPPPRLRRATPTSYSIELPKALRGIRDSMHIRQWDLRYSRRLVPKGYRYTHYQIPSGVIGDFDGDSLADVAIYGYDGDNRNTVACLLSNGGSPRGTRAWLEPGAAKRNGGPSRPSFYMERCPSGQPVVDSQGIRMVLATDAVYTISGSGEKTILYYENGNFHRGRPAPGSASTR